MLEMSKTKIEVLYQDSNLLVINKPNGVSVTKNRTGLAKLADILAEQLGSQQVNELRLTHRLDKDTSGVMMLAKTKEAQSEFCSYFEKKLIRKTYLAIVRGFVNQPQGIIDSPITHDERKSGKMCIARKKGKKAVTEWSFLADFGSVALLSVSPVTERTHQIRVHLSSIGLPLAIDSLYGSSRGLYLSDFKMDYRLGKGQTEKPLIERMSLHAYQLEFLKSQSIPDCFIAPLDKKFKAVIKLLTKHNPNGPDAFTCPADYEKIINGEKLAD